VHGANTIIRKVTPTSLSVHDPFTPFQAITSAFQIPYLNRWHRRGRRRKK